MKEPRCEMLVSCTHPVTHIDDKGFIYCTDHGLDRRASRRKCRKMRPYEINRINKGLPLKRY